MEENQEPTDNTKLNENFEEILDNRSSEENVSDTLEFNSRLDLREFQNDMERVRNEIGKVIVGQGTMIEMLLASLLCKGHSLIEGVPGIAKTVTAKLLSKTLSVGFSRIQFTPDLMPSDILGTSVFNLKSSEFEFKKGPIFSNMILIDEINRSPAKTQAALFEVMEEQQITMDGTKYEMESPFMVLATQNPVEQEGTYRLPEAQLDRFLFKINVDYPNLNEEIEILKREHVLEDKSKLNAVNSFLTREKIIAYQDLVTKVLIEEHLLHYIGQIIVATRNNPFLYIGASPRASIAILKASKAFAALGGRDFVTPEDIKRAAIPVLHHRVIVTPEREMEGLTADDIIKQILESVEIPR